MATCSLDTVILRREALAAGYTDRDLAKLVAGGELHKLRHGAYVDGALWRGRSPEARHALLVRAVLKQSRTPLVASHLSAMPEYGGPLWGVPLDIVHVSRHDRRAGRKEAGVSQHQGLLLPEDVVTGNGMELTSATRTAIDVTTVAPVEQALVMVNHLLHQRWTTLDQIRSRYLPMEQCPYTLRTDLVLRLVDPRVASVGESRTFFVLWHHRLPKPEPQFAVTDQWGRTVAYLDFAWPERRCWLEFDGRQKYVTLLREGETATDAVLREKSREDMVRELTGWRCIRVTWADLADPEGLAARIRAFLG